MLVDSNKYKYDINCANCTPTESCPICAEKLKKPWREEIPPRFVGASLTDVTLSETAFSTIRRFIETCIDKDRSGSTGLYICGDLGVGKTWILYAIINRLIEVTNPRKRPSPPFLFEDCKALVFKYHCRYTGKGENSVVDYTHEFTQFSKNNLLVLDDLGHGNTTKDDFALNIYNILLDSLYVNLGFVAISSNHDPSELRNYIGPYAVDRIVEMCGNNIIKATGNSRRIQ